MSVPPTPPVGGPPQGPLATGQAVSAASAPTPLAQAPDPVATLMARAVDAVRADAAVRQSGMGSLMADLRPALASPNLPPDVKAAIRQVMAFGLNAEAALDTAMLKAAVARSGLFLEAQLARTPAAAPGDLKAALLVLHGALVAAGAANLARPPRTASAPPSKGGVVASQPVREAALSPDDSTEQLLAVLRDKAEQAVARQTLHQLASTPDEVSGGRWMFELPVLTAQGGTVAQFAVDRDEAHTGPDGQPTWRARFALDIPPLGPVQVHLRLHDGRCTAVLWVERQDSLMHLRDQSADLAYALSGDVVVHGGAPSTASQVPPPPPGQLLDRKS